MTKLIIALWATLAFSTLAWAETSVITGTVAKVVEKKKEIYVEADGKKNEYYFNEKTTVSRGSAPAAFSDLKTGMKVKVTADKKGKRLDPQAVEILE